MLPLRDMDIRTAAKARLLARAQSCPDTRIVGTRPVPRCGARRYRRDQRPYPQDRDQARSRSAVPAARQLSAYRRVVNLATLVAAERHIDAAAAQLPDWWGIIEARKTGKGTVAFRRLRDEKVNRGLDPVTLAQLLWRAEVAGLLRQFGADERLLRSPRAILYAELVAALPITRLRRSVRETLKARENWRDRARPSSYDGSFQPSATC